MPVFDAAVLAESVDAQAEFIEKLICPGIALIKGVGTPEHLEREHAGKPLEDLVQKMVGKLNQHPVRSTTYGVMRKTAESAKQGADYDMNNPLSMHTDHSVYPGTPGSLQFLYQAEGSVRSKVCDGLALAEYVKEYHPEAYKLLTTVEMTHSSRNTLYTKEGAPRSVYDQSTSPAPFELVHTHPIICLDAEGQVEKVVQSETKRGVSALPYEVYGPFMEAYELWTQLCEDERFIKHFDWPEGTCVVTNNWRTLHGRASVAPGMARTMAFGYLGKILVENRYRLLKQIQTGRADASMDDRWLTRIPNQVLEKLVVE
jgi:gamma-butyrobetaine dioxygenase